MDYKKVYKEWLDNDYVDEDTKQEIKRNNKIMKKK